MAGALGRPFAGRRILPTAAAVGAGRKANAVGVADMVRAAAEAVGLAVRQLANAAAGARLALPGGSQAAGPDPKETRQPARAVARGGVRGRERGLQNCCSGSHSCSIPLGVRRSCAKSSPLTQPRAISGPAKRRRQADEKGNLGRAAANALRLVHWLLFFIHRETS